ncbi:MAG: hypothetical protein KGQ54_03600, partial [Verrucomicrobia bacterium]|nr:hypothetical protein [Verrucomicrobiota bacterium]
VAIHIRQGDFRDWQEGKYYISPQLTCQALSSAGWNLKDTRCRVWVCSDEAMPENIFPFESIQGIPRALGDDLFIMSRCQRLFAGWSSLAYFCAFLGSNNFYRLRLNNLIWEPSDVASLLDV